MKTKILPAILALLMVLAGCAGTQRYDPESDFSTAPVDGGNSLEITGYAGGKQAVNIPPRINNLPVTSIGKYAFEDAELTSVSIPGSVTSIGYAAFWGNSFASVTLPSGVTSIRDEAFAYCTSLASLAIPAGVRSIGGGAFAYCTSLTSLTIPAGVTFIGGGAFRNWTPSQAITIQGHANQASADSAWGAAWRDGCDARIVYRG